MFKFLDPAGCIYYEGKLFVYNLPRSNRKYATTRHPEPAEPDGQACGPGRLHAMKSLNAQYAPPVWWPWWAMGTGLIGEDEEKAAYAVLKLRRIPRRVFWRALRPPFNWGRGAVLRGAVLRGANLVGADLSGADLSGANMSRADLHGADLGGANLHRAVLSRADLSKADLHRADLGGADLREANLCEADLHGVILSEANLCGADLREANLRRADLYGANLRGADLCWADLYGANLGEANLSGANVGDTLLAEGHHGHNLDGIVGGGKRG